MGRIRQTLPGSAHAQAEAFFAEQGAAPVENLWGVGAGRAVPGKSISQERRVRAFKVVDGAGGHGEKSGACALGFAGRLLLVRFVDEMEPLGPTGQHEWFGNAGGDESAIQERFLADGAAPDVSCAVATAEGAFEQHGAGGNLEAFVPCQTRNWS